MMFRRSVPVDQIRQLHQLMTIVKKWEKTLGTDQQYLLRGVYMELLRLNQPNANISEIENMHVRLQFIRLYDRLRDAAWFRLFKKDAVLYQKARKVFDDQHMSYYSPQQFEAKVRWEELVALRSEVDMLKERIEQVLPPS